MISKSDFEGLLVLGFCVLALYTVTPIAWKFFSLARSTRSFISNAVPVRQLSDEERTALKFLGGPARGFIQLVGVTQLPLHKLAAAQGAKAAVYQLRGPLGGWGYQMHPGGEVHYAMQDVEVFMPLEDINSCTTEDNLVEVVFCKKIGVILTCNDQYSIVDTSAKWQTLLQPGEKA
ncbi:MAG: hypothetical protein ACRER3_09470 [Pseudomonas fluorescens]